MTDFAETQGMSPSDITAFVIGRLEGGRGPAVNKLRDEPVWGVLLSGFATWRTRADNLVAFQGTLLDIWHRALAQHQWATLQSTCEFVCALASLETPWTPPNLDAWQLLHHLDAEPKSELQMRAFTAMYHLAMVWPNPPENDYCREKFRTSCRLPGDVRESWHSEWILVCWEVLLRDAKTVGERDWLLLWQSTDALDSRNRLRFSKRALRWAWLSTDGNDENRHQLMQYAVKTLGDLGVLQIELRKELVQLIVTEFETNPEIAAAATQDLAEVQTAASSNTWVRDHLRTPSRASEQSKDNGRFSALHIIKTAGTQNRERGVALR